MDADATGIKLVFAGPVGAGKTTALRALSDEPPVSTEMPLTDGAMGEKTTTTVALDFSSVMLDDGTPLQLFGLPGQAHFSHMRGIVMTGALGVVVLVAGDRNEVADDCREWLGTVESISPGLPMVVGITQTDRAPGFRMDALRGVVAGRRPSVPLFTIDAREPAQVEHLVRALLLSID